MHEIKAGAPVEARVITRREDGSGVVEIPVAVATPVFNAKRSETGRGPSAITKKMLEEMVANFPKWPGPVTVGVGSHLRDVSGPAAGFYESVEMRGETMWARLDLGPEMFDQVVTRRAWRSFSIEAAKDVEKASGNLSGWALTGGIFTNAPALDIQYAIAASGVVSDVDAFATVSLVRGEGVSDMSEDVKSISLASHEAKVQELRQEALAAKSERDQYKDGLDKARNEVAALQEKLEDVETRLSASEGDKIQATAQANRLRADLNARDAEVKSLRVSLTEAEQKIAAADRERTENKVRELVTDAIEAGVKPATFDGWEADPADYISANYGNVDTFERFVTALRSHVEGKGKAKLATKSGHDPKTSASENEDRSDFSALKSTLAAKGVDLGEIDFSQCSTEEEVEALMKAHAAK